jgi:hypothetical protein
LSVTKYVEFFENGGSPVTPTLNGGVTVAELPLPTQFTLSKMNTPPLEPSCPEAGDATAIKANTASAPLAAETRALRRRRVPSTNAAYDGRESPLRGFRSNRPHSTQSATRRARTADLLAESTHH